MSTDRVAAVSTQNTLRKVGAHLRWLMEKNCVDAEAARVVVVVPDEVSRSRLISGLLREFDPGTMSRADSVPGYVRANGVSIFVIVEEKERA